MCIYVRDDCTKKSVFEETVTKCVVTSNSEESAIFLSIVLKKDKNKVKSIFKEGYDQKC